MEGLSSNLPEIPEVLQGITAEEVETKWRARLPVPSHFHVPSSESGPNYSHFLSVARDKLRQEREEDVVSG